MEDDSLLLIMVSVGWTAGPHSPQVPGQAHHVHRGMAGEVQGHANKVCQPAIGIGLLFEQTLVQIK